MKVWIKAVTLVLFLLTISSARYASTGDSPVQNGSYEVLTHVVVGANSGGSKKTLSKGVAAAISTVKPDFQYDSFLPGITYFQSTGDGGNISSQSMIRSLGSTEALGNPILTELSYGGFKVDEADPGSIAIKAFSFLARLPVRYKGIDKNAENMSLVQFENIKIGLVNVSVNIGSPKLIASLPLPDNDETLFFVVDVRRAGPK